MVASTSGIVSLRAAGESLGVPLADHLVVGSDTFHSFRAAEGWDHC